MRYKETIFVMVLTLATCFCNDIIPTGKFWAIGLGIGIAFVTGRHYGEAE